MVSTAIYSSSVPLARACMVPGHWDTISMDAQNILNRIPTCQRYYTIKYMDGPQFTYTCTTTPGHTQPVNSCGNCDHESEIHQLALTAVAVAARIYCGPTIIVSNSVVRSNSTMSSAYISSGSEKHITASTGASSMHSALPVYFIFTSFRAHRSPISKDLRRNERQGQGQCLA